MHRVAAHTNIQSSPSQRNIADTIYRHSYILGTFVLAVSSKHSTDPAALRAGTATCSSSTCVARVRSVAFRSVPSAPLRPSLTCMREVARTPFADDTT